MKIEERKAVSSAIFAVGIIVALVVAGVAGYYGRGAVGAQTVTVTQGSTGTGTGGTSQGSFDLQYLINQCKAEGSTVTVNNVADSSAFPTIQKYLAQSYPWLTANLVSWAPPDLVSKATAEYQAGHVTSDVLQDSFAEAIEMNQSGLFQPFFDPQPYYLNGTNTPAAPTLGTTHGLYYGYGSWIDPLLIIYNTKLVPANQAPKSVSDLAQPYFKGKVVFDNPAILNVAGALFASIEPSMGNASWTTLMKSIAANSPILTSDAGVSASDVVSGQAVVGVALYDDYAYNIGNGAPIAAVSTNPIYVLTSPWSLAKGGPHPACGELFIDWATSYAGNVAIQQTARPSAYPFINTQFLAASALPTNVSYTPQATGAPSYFTDTAGWASYYSSIFGKP